ncbi:hypothetical protein ACHAXA_001608 [Cyclostephanos tholiformis]|uniref:Uncharacterized protein n=1 Tax=Cyclostephanos tholiformis TaxID=382380 RepID=A0ABD3RCU2_9STRA
MYKPDEELILDRAVRDYCASKNVTLTQLCGGGDHRKHDKALRGAWAEIARCPFPIGRCFRCIARLFDGTTA